MKANSKNRKTKLLFTELAITLRLGVRALTLTLNDGRHPLGLGFKFTYTKKSKLHLDSSLLLLIITHPNLGSVLVPSTLV